VSQHISTNPESGVLILLLDISMPPYEDKGIYSGEDLAKLLLEYMPIAKLFYLQCSLSFKDKKQS
jgi:hypothetical protein